MIKKITVFKPKIFENSSFFHSVMNYILIGRGSFNTKMHLDE